MRGFSPSRFALAALLSLLVPVAVQAAQTGQPVVSSMRNVRSNNSVRGYFLMAVTDIVGQKMPGDEAPPQTFELIRPNDEPVTIGRLYTSCSCVVLSTMQRTYARGERVLFELRNVRPTPSVGQMYAFYVQVGSPINATLRYDTYVQSDRFKPQTPEAAPDAAPTGETAADAAVETETEPAVAGEGSEAAAEGAAESADAISGATESGSGATESGADGDAAADESGQTTDAVPAGEAEQTDDARAGEEQPVEEPDPAAAFRAETAQRERGVPPPTISLITLGVQDLDRSVAFYQDLGWTPIKRESFDHIAFFQLNGQVLCLYPMDELLREQNMEEAKPSPGGVTLALHVADRDEVEAVYQTFKRAGAVTLKEPTAMPSGAVTAYVTDPEGNGWEISWVPHFKVGPRGELWLP